MSTVIPVGSCHFAFSSSLLSTGKAETKLSMVTVAVQRLSTDALYYANVTLYDAVVGSRYWLVKSTDHSVVLATGLVASDTEVLSNIPAYSSPMLMLLRLRNATGATKYKEYEASVPHSSTGAEFYCAQELDE